MSVLNLTFSYIGPMAYAAKNTFDAVSFRQKKILIKTGLIASLFLVIFYLYLASSLIAKTADKSNAEALLQEKESMLGQTERFLLEKKELKDVGFFISQGFEKPQKIDFIKRTTNVAKGKEILSQYR